ncbi:hypothetical protein [Pararhizobium antarcticum]
MPLSFSFFFSGAIGRLTKSRPARAKER